MLSKEKFLHSNKKCQHPGTPEPSRDLAHGTLWFWSDRARTYQSHEIEVANLAAGRLMSEIEHSLMGTEIREARDVVKSCFNSIGSSGNTLARTNFAKRPG